MVETCSAQPSGLFIRGLAFVLQNGFGDFIGRRLFRISSQRSGFEEDIFDQVFILL
ncbi:hypothetical protein CEV33_2371 [Brucella grignonensis]|uniref:Uncharacterized protein n=1 Tax=Brucella grignonensis TaxID=94627 RepID=A0A256F7S6_9HYPH|nr:hypothetical protein CEV33_2371 [Brucella grignonensis]